MAILRTENALIRYSLEGSYADGSTIPSNRFGIHETADLPDLEVDWTPIWTVGSGRNRSHMVPGRWTLKGAIPNIRLQKNSNLAELLSLGIGRVVGNTIYEGKAVNDDRLNSIVVQAAIKDATGVGYGLVRNYVGGKVNRATLSAREGEDLQYSLDEILFSDMGHDQVGVYKIGYPSVAADSGSTTGGRFLFAGAKLQFFGTTVCRVKSFNLSIDNQLEPKYYLCRGNSSVALSNTPNDIVEGKRVWKMNVELDVVDHLTDLVLWNYMLNQAGTGPITGGSLVLDFAPTEGSTGNIIINCGIGYSASNPGAIVTGGSIDMPGPPAGYFTGNFQLDINSVSITVS